MKGLELAERYYFEVCAPMLQKKFPDWMKRMAAGLVGDGSECYGYDDELSRDHDWGAEMCLWLTDEDYAAFGNEVAAEVSKLPQSFLDYPVSHISSWGHGRRGVLTIGSFYRKFLGTDAAPTTLAEWRRIPEHHLAAATNGRVFADYLGAFSAVRHILIHDYYPEDIRKKKLVARCMTAAQAGQYNYSRIVARGEWVAAHLATAEFLAAAGSITYLLNKRYAPFYKWMHRGLQELPVQGKAVAELMDRLVKEKMPSSKEANCQCGSEIIEEICALVITELRRQGLSDSTSSFLLDHGLSIHNTIENTELRNTNPWAE